MSNSAINVNLVIIFIIIIIIIKEVGSASLRESDLHSVSPTDDTRSTIPTYRPIQEKRKKE